MSTGNNISNDLARRCNGSNAELTKMHVDLVIEQCCSGVAHERSQENERYDCIVDVVIWFKLRKE